MIKVVSFKICPFVQRVTALLEAKNVPYEIEYIDLKNKPEWFLAISPTGQVPVLITEAGTPLFESDAIAEYLDEVYTPLVTDMSPEQRASERAWGYQATKHYLVQCSAMQSADAETLSESSARLGRAFGKAEKQLGAGPYFSGPVLGNVDIAWLPLLHRAAIVEQHSGFDFLAHCPKVKAWQERLLQTGLAERSVPDDFPDVFARFYLSERTYLGVGDRCTAIQDGTAACCG